MLLRGRAGGLIILGEINPEISNVCTCLSPFPSVYAYDVCRMKDFPSGEANVSDVKCKISQHDCASENFP